jgi:2'-5' RNA ligase
VTEREQVRLFIAAWLPDDVADSLAALARPGEPGVRWVPRQNLHVTLRFLGQAVVDEVAPLLAGTVFPRSTASLGPVVSRMGHDLIVVPVSGLDQLAARVAEATSSIGKSEPRGFHGHITLARLRQRAACGVTGTRVQGGFEVHEVALVRSRTLPNGAEYETLDTFATR